jgi:hypothetical protein
MQILYILVFFIYSILYAQGEEVLPSKSSEQITSTPTIITRNIEYFSFKNLAHDMYNISVQTNKPDELIQELNGKKDRKLRFEIGDIKTDILPNSAELDKDNGSMVNLIVVAYYKIPEGKTPIKLFSKLGDLAETLESSKEFDIPNSNDIPGKQPFVELITPEGGVRGDTITIKGSNFGNHIDDIIVEFSESTKTETGDDTYVEIAENKPFYLSPIINESQEIKFNIPLRKDLLRGSHIRKSLKIRILVNGRPSNYVDLTLLPTSWRIAAALASGFITILFLIFIYMILRGLIKSSQSKELAGWDGKGGGIKRPSILHYIELILSDKATNTYSLSRFQAFAWTITSIASYIYVAFSQAILLKNGKIPDFNPSLVVLMSISYGGLLAAGGMSSKKPKNEIKSKPPELSNLFCEGGSVDLSRLQLFGFTIVSIIVYLFNLWYSNPLQGLPEVPSTLLGLMGVSQSGYLGGKALGKEISINTISPDWIQVSQEGVKISVLGSGFSSGTKVLITGSTPIDTLYISSKELQFILPRYDHPAKLFFDLIPSNGSPVHCDAPIEIVDVGQEGYVVNAPNPNMAEPAKDVLPESHESVQS